METYKTMEEAKATCAKWNNVHILREFVSGYGSSANWERYYVFFTKKDLKKEWKAFCSRPDPYGMQFSQAFTKIDEEWKEFEF